MFYAKFCVGVDYVICKALGEARSQVGLFLTLPMNDLIDNLDWMTLNVALAVLGLVFGLLFIYIKEKFLKWVFLVLWILFIPNTIYLITDIEYLPKQLVRQNFTFQFLLFLQYLSLVVIGIGTFIYGLSPFDKLFKGKKNNELKAMIIFALNFLIAFAVVMGKFQRTHSWYVFTDPFRVYRDTLVTLNSTQLMIYVLLFGFLFNAIYFFLKRTVLRINI